MATSHVEKQRRLSTGIYLLLTIAAVVGLVYANAGSMHVVKTPSMRKLLQSTGSVEVKRWRCNWQDWCDDWSIKAEQECDDAGDNACRCVTKPPIMPIASVMTRPTMRGRSAMTRHGSARLQRQSGGTRGASGRTHGTLG